MDSSFIRIVVTACLTLICASAQAQPAGADAYPVKVVRLVVGYAPGGSTDIVARAVAHRLNERWGTQVVVENRPGADTIIATDTVAKAQPDGYTLLLANSTNATNPSVIAKLPYDPLRDFTSVVLLGAATNLLSANPSFPPNSLKEMIALARARPGEITYAHVGAGSSQHLLIEHFALRARVKFLPVPYKGGGPAVIDTMAGHVSTMIGSVATQESYIKAGRLKPLVVFSATRSAVLPRTPTIAEQGFPDLQSEYWIGIMGPANLPAAVVAKLNTNMNAVLNLPEIRERFKQIGVDPLGGSAEDMDRYYRKELILWANVVRDAGIERK
ncbi:MAG: tripartite tricarboxylate transporter substrate binding protein [Betaproteobacteria bacterium]|nr:tripartite tricarboxylate transporter substrate binding protein [Betaproteobacteria bacterium]